MTAKGASKTSEGTAEGAREELSYEQARAELASVVEKLEAGGATLEESLALWQRGEKLADICQSWLDGARARLTAAREDRSTQ
jgi:exodeoxyribonuclease VII small subunit